MDTNQFKFLIYRATEGDVSVNAIIKDETIWLTQKAMAELFGVDKSSVSRHLKNIFTEGELDEKVVVAEFTTTTQHGAMSGKTQSRDTKFYNLDAIISVGYRINSRRATQFRIWVSHHSTIPSSNEPKTKGSLKSMCIIYAIIPLTNIAKSMTMPLVSRLEWCCK